MAVKTHRRKRFDYIMKSEIRFDDEEKSWKSYVDGGVDHDLEILVQKVATEKQ